MKTGKRMNFRSRAGSSLAVLCWMVLAACGGDDTKDSNKSADAGETAMSQRPPDEGERQPDAGTVREGSSSSSKSSCADLQCDAPAKCEQRDGKAVCSCPAGYEDVKGDGSDCKDRDECASDEAKCGKHATCKNTPGSFECSCDGPAYAGDGKQCHCADGYKEQDGVCIAQDGGKCSDNLDCANGHCVSGVCCATACDKPDAECKATEGATCEDGKTCKYPTAKDGTACDDGDACMEDSTCKAGKCQPGTRPLSCDDQNPCTADSCDKQLGCKNVAVDGKCDDANGCTMNDQCKAGSCVGTPLDCSAQRDACNDGACDPKDGTCHKQPARDGAACDDADSCSTGDRCAAGSCKGPDSACGPNATACTPGAANSCICKPEFQAANGVCVPQNDECAAQPCSANATCFDPSNAAGDVTCKCKPDYEGDGKNCVPKDPCKDNPCGEGRGTCTAGTAGAYTCSCSAGFKPVGGTCGCDLTGTFAGRSTFDQSWSNIVGFEDGKVTTYNWLIQRNQVAADGSIDAEVILCGESPVDLCGNALGNEAYAQWLARNYYDAGASSAKFSYRIDKAAVPGASYETPAFALLAGISLSDPLGAWPTDRKQIQGGPDFSGSAVNGARWVDMDNDSFEGVTTYNVGPDGMSADGDGPRPLSSFGMTSAACPRNNPNAKRYPYAYPPAADGLIVRRVKRFYTASRVIDVMRGKLDSCDGFSGDVRGPNDSDVAKSDGTVGGCVRVNGDGEAACSSQILDFIGGEGASATQMTNSSKYTFKRVADNISCADVRGMSF